MTSSPPLAAELTPTVHLISLVRSLGLASILALAGCAALPDKPVRAVTYDFGPGAVAAPANPALTAQPLPALALAEIEASSALDGTAVLYRLNYANPAELRPYAQARWSMAPTQLVRQRLRAQLGATRAVLNVGEASIAAPNGSAVAAPAGTAATSAPTAGSLVSPWVLRTELEEFSQHFESTSSSVGLLRLRATVVQATAQGDRLVGQRAFVVQRPAPSADVSGGVRALTLASDAVAIEIEQWLGQLR